jgi:MinD superfamily P-loop ATPase
MADIKINLEKCCGCGICIKSCPYNAIKVVDKKAVILENCVLCGACASSCKFMAIEFEKDKDDSTVDKSAYKGVWIFGEQKNGEVSGVALELLGEGRKLADQLGVSLAAVLMGDKVEPAARKLISYGPTRYTSWTILHWAILTMNPMPTYLCS